MVEYEALVNGCRIAAEVEARCFLMRGDSKLVVDQVMKATEPRDPRMCAYYREVHKLEEKFKGFELEHNYRHFNEEVDRLSTIAFGREPVPEGVFVSDLHEPFVKIEQSDEEVPMTRANLVTQAWGLVAVTGDPDWCLPIINRLTNGDLPGDVTDARRLAHKAKSFILINEELYKKSVSGIKQKCIPISEGRQLLADIHGGTCGHHAAPRSLVGKAFRQGFYWPMAMADAEQVVRTYEGYPLCQADTYACANIADHPHHMAFRSLGFGHGRAP